MHRPISICVLAIAALLVPCAVGRAQHRSHGKTGSEAADQTGHALVTIGDLNADGCDDLVVTEPRWNHRANSDVGRARVVDGLTGATLRSHQGASAFDLLGWSVAPVGDWTGDGVIDYAIGIHGYDTPSFANAGRVEVFSGLTGTLIESFDGDATLTSLGTTLARAADADADGAPDLLAGLHGIAEARIYGSGGSLAATIPGPVGSLFARNVAALDDVTGDGIDDFAISEEGYDSTVPPLVDCGRVHVYSGATHAIAFSIVGLNAGDHFGGSIARLGDLNGDGVDEFAIGSPEARPGGLQDAGQLRVFDGATHATRFTIDGVAVGAGVGYAACGIADGNHDGVPDFAVGAPSASVSARGVVEVRSGSDGTVLWELFGVSDGVGDHHELGSALAGGDWNGDGIGDFAAGDPSWVELATNDAIGRADLWLGCPAWSDQYGTGLAGTNGIPTIDAVNEPVLGATFDTYVTNSAGAPTLALLMAGSQAIAVPYKGGTLLASSDLLALFFTLPSGGATFTEDAPNDPALAFVDLYAQVLMVDPGATGGIALTPGLRLRIGYDVP